MERQIIDFKKFDISIEESKDRVEIWLHRKKDRKVIGRMEIVQNYGKGKRNMVSCDTYL